MTSGHKIAWAVAVLVVLGAALIIALRARKLAKPSEQEITLEGAVMRQDSDPRKQTPLEDATIEAKSGTVEGKTKSDASGLFKLRIGGLKAGEAVSVRVTHDDYQPMELTRTAANELLIARLEPGLGRPSQAPRNAEVTIKDVRVRYTVKVQSKVSVGFEAKTFIVQNLGDVACEGQPPCSPDGKWKAATGSLMLDAGDGNEFNGIRVSCIAGPCPFTNVVPAQIVPGARYAKASATTWSDTATFLVEAEVTRTHIADMVRYSYPVTFGPSMNFTLPGTAEGPSIEATLNGTDIVFPLGPALILSWGTCSMQVAGDGKKIYRCELKPGYAF